MKPGDIVESPFGPPGDGVVTDPFGHDKGGQALLNDAYIGLGGVNEGVAKVLNLPRSVMGEALSVLPPPPKFLSDSKNPYIRRAMQGFNQSEFDKATDVRNTFRAVGAPVGSTAEIAKSKDIPLTPGRKIIGNVGEEVGGVLTSLFPMLAAAKYSKPAASLIDSVFVQPFRAAPAAATAQNLVGATAGGLAGGALDAATGDPTLKTAGTLAGYGVGSSLANLVGKTVSGLGTAAKQGIALATPEKTAERVAGQVLRETGFTPNTAVPDMPLPGMRATIGMRTANPDMLAIERANLTNIGKRHIAEDMLQGNQAVVRGVLTDMAGKKLPEAASTELAGAYRGLQQQVKNYVSPNIEAAKEAVASVSMPGNVLKGHVNSLYSGMTDAAKESIPGNVRNLLERQFIKKSVPFGEVDAINELVKKAARDMPYGSKARMQVEQFAAGLNNLFAYKQPGVKAAFQDYGLYKQAFEKNHRVGDLFTKKAPGVYDVEASKFGDKLFAKPQEAVRYMASLPAPEAKKLGKEFLVSRLSDSIRASGNVTPDDMVKFIRSNRAGIKNYFSQPDMEALRKVHDAVNLNANWLIGTKGAGSPTYEKLTAGSFLEGAFKIAAKIPFAKGAVRGAEENVQKRVSDLLVEASFNPTLAKILTMKASEGNLLIANKMLANKPEFLPLLGQILGTRAVRPEGSER